MKKSIIMTGAASLLLLVSSCCGCRGGKSISHTLTSDSWKLVELGGGEKLTASEDNSYTITFDGQEGRVFGRGDCNSYFGSYKEEPTRRLSFSHMGSTRMMCPNQAGEDKFMSALGKVDSYTLDGDNLMLQNNGEVVAIFEAIPLINVEK